jgi:hypothetical protein
MARRKRGSVSAYFRTVFEKNPAWLLGKSNKPVLAQYRADHSLGENAEVPQRIRNNLANLKSILRKKHRGRSGARLVSVKTVPGSKLEGLEELIDECLTMAKNLDRSGLESVIRKLRSARNEVVWKIGQ